MWIKASLSHFSPFYNLITFHYCHFVCNVEALPSLNIKCRNNQRSQVTCWVKGVCSNKEESKPCEIERTEIWLSDLLSYAVNKQQKWKNVGSLLSGEGYFHWNLPFKSLIQSARDYWLVSIRIRHLMLQSPDDLPCVSQFMLESPHGLPLIIPFALTLCSSWGLNIFESTYFPVHHYHMWLCVCVCACLWTYPCNGENSKK